MNNHFSNSHQHLGVAILGIFPIFLYLILFLKNHHKMFDSNILFLSNSGEVSYKDDLSNDDIEYINSITTVSNLPNRLITPSYIQYINRRYSTASA
jgi:hypothetical protein